MQTDRPRRFSDFAVERVPLDGEKIKLDSIINQEIMVIGYAINRSKYDKNSSGKVLTLQFEHAGRRLVVFTGSDVLIEQMQKYGDEVPFATTIKKIDRFYTLT